MKRSMIVSSILLAALVLSACSPLALATTLAGTALSQSAPSVQQSKGVEAKVTVDSAPQVVESNTLEQIYERVNPSVVNIQVVTQAQNTNFAPGFPFGDQRGLPSTQSTALGSGFVWDEDGHIVTNNHVVEDASQVSVMFSDGFVVPADVVATDSYSDLAVIKVDMPADRLQPVALAPSVDVAVGQTAIAIGNPFGLEGTMTLGIISAMGRSLPVNAGVRSGATYSIPNVIQTDAPINPGNSGGVLLNIDGEVIGVTTAIESTTEANAGIGFAVPSDIIAKVIPALIAEGKYEYPYLGISGTTLNYNLNQSLNLSEDQRGVLVAEVTQGGPADEAGLRGSETRAQQDGSEQIVGADIITHIDGNPVTTFEGMVAYLIEKKSPGDSARLTVLRDGDSVEVTITLGARPANQ